MTRALAVTTRDSAATRDSRPVLRRSCGCATCCRGTEEEQGPVLRRRAHRPAPSSEAPPIVNRVLGAPGRSLDRDTRSVMERHFQRDLSRVRVHTGDLAARSARAVGAQAYTVGQHVVFDSGRFAPRTPVGSALLAHELAHTIQQPSIGRTAGTQPIPIGAASDRAEREADGLARGAPAGSPAVRVDRRVQRVPAGEQLARFFGFLFGYEGDFDDEELLEYLDLIETKGAPEGALYGDNRARAVVRRWSQKADGFELPAPIRAILIQEMLEGIVVEGDQTAILALLEGSDDSELATILGKVSADTLRAGLDLEAPKKRLKAVLNGHDERRRTGVARTTGAGGFGELDVFLTSLTDAKRKRGPADRRLAREIVARWKGGDPRFVLEVERKTALVEELTRDPVGTKDAEAVLDVLSGSKPGEVDVIVERAKLADRVDAVPEKQRPKVSGIVDAASKRAKESAERGSGKIADDWIQRIVVDQNGTQTVTAHWKSGRQESDIASAGKGHCCVDKTAAKGATCSEAESRIKDTNCTPVGEHTVQALRKESGGGIPFWTEFVSFRGIALHPYPRVDGTPLSHGCVRLHDPMARTLWNNSREEQTKVLVKGLARPRCDHPKLQSEWHGDFVSAAYSPPDGEDVKMLSSVLGLTGKKLDSAVAKGKESVEAAAKMIPRCVATQTFEEHVADSSGSTNERLAAGGMADRVKSFSRSLAKTTSFKRAKKLVGAAGTDLWEAAARNVQADTDDDRSLYWARLALAKTLREWKPRWLGHRKSGLSNPDDVRRQKTELLELLEQSSRGMAAATFQSSDKKHILVSGFDPFGLQGGSESRINPSGAAVLALDGRTLERDGVEAEVRGVIFPVRFADFDQGKIESFFRPYLKGPRKVDMIMTISQGGLAATPKDVEQGFAVEQFAAGARSSGTFEGNLGQVAGGTKQKPKETPGTKGPAFLETELPTEAIRKELGRDAPTVAETTVRELPKGSSRPRKRKSGPTAGARAIEGSGGGFLSNEIFYRTSLLRSEVGSDVPVGHLHTPYVPVPSGDADQRQAVDDLRRAISAKVEDVLEATIPTL